MESKKFTLNWEDVKKVAKNALIFAAPAILVLLADVVKALPSWFSGAWLIILLWIVNLITDAIRKFITGK